MHFATRNVFFLVKSRVESEDMKKQEDDDIAPPKLTHQHKNQS